MYVAYYAKNDQQPLQPQPQQLYHARLAYHLLGLCALVLHHVHCINKYKFKVLIIFKFLLENQERASIIISFWDEETSLEQLVSFSLTKWQTFFKTTWQMSKLIQYYVHKYVQVLLHSLELNPLSHTSQCCTGLYISIYHNKIVLKKTKLQNP